VSQEHSLSPAQLLKGKQLANGWNVIEQIVRPKNATGGCFSQSYIVESESGTRAFLKAMDYKRAFASGSPAQNIEPLVVEYNFERSLLKVCVEKRLSKVIKIIDTGKINIIESDPFSVVEYIIFEIAQGDIRNYISGLDNIDTAWILRLLHNTAVGLKQLHSVQIAHQDIKPSNVLVFDGTSFKITDLGRAAQKSQQGPHDEHDIPGDRGYAPPELLYGQINGDWESRRYGGDCYLFGSLIVFLFTGVNMTCLLKSKMEEDFLWTNWNEGYESVLPYLRRTYAIAINDIDECLQETLPDKVRIEIMYIIRLLCDPDPKLRGHAKDRAGRGNSYSLERFCSVLDRLAKGMEYGLFTN